ncbi:hypothetical protein [Runella zeae]|uniref:hypothetical protein n=1 Tax=Runella zeae TaxID=94255 RepID=UPI000407B21D|nr:hypothetical protein [Runella zeae]
MLKNTVTAGIWSQYQRHAAPASFFPRKPAFSMAKTKAKLAEFFHSNEQIRKLCQENKDTYPRMHQSVQNTAWQLLMHYIKNWGKPTARAYEIRITHSYLRKALNDSCCIATIKNHINKLLGMYKPFLTEKYRGGLGLHDQNTPCIILKVNPLVLQFEDERHNEAVKVGELSAEESRYKTQQTNQKHRVVGASIMAAKAQVENQAQKRSETPSAIASIFENSFAHFLKRE